MLSLCYDQHFTYFLCIMFPSPCILQHYFEFNIHTIVMLQNLLDAGSFGGSISHLICHQAILLTFLNKFNFPSIVQTIGTAFLGCWALIIHVLVTHFEHDDHPILLDAIAHVEINISPSQMTL